MTTVAVVGAGGVGGLIAAKLAGGGHDVRFVARGATLAAIREHGLVVHGPDGDHRARIAKADSDPAKLGVAQIVIVTVKAWQLADLAPRLRPLVGADTAVLPLQNGVEASELLGAALGDDRVLGAVAHMISWAEQPGEIRWIGIAPSVTLGARHDGQAELVQRCAATLRTSGIQAIITPAIERVRWAKLLFIAPFGAVGAAEGATAGTIRREPRTRAQLEGAMREVAAVAAARGIELAADAVAVAMQRIDSLPEDATASMQRDLVAGRRSELRELIGAVVRLGHQAHVDTQVSAELLAKLEPRESQARMIDVISSNPT